MYTNDTRVSILEMNYRELQSEMPIAKNSDNKMKCIQVGVSTMKLIRLKDLCSQMQLMLPGGELVATIHAATSMQWITSDKLKKRH